MPIYEYRCNRCQATFSILFLSRHDAGRAECLECGSSELTRLISSFAFHQNEASRMAALDISKPRDESYYKDSRNVGLWAKKRMLEMGCRPGSALDEAIEKGRTMRGQ